MLFGRTLQIAKATTGGGNEEHDRQFSDRIGFRWATEYFSPQWSYGLSVAFDETTLRLRDVSIKSTVGMVMISVGTTLDAFF